MAQPRTMFGVGVYDLLVASHLLGIDERTLRRWSQPDDAGKAALVPPTHGWAFSFHDIISLAVIAVLRQRGLRPAGIRESIRQLEMRFDYDRPLAHEDVVEGLSTVGSSLLLHDEQTDISRGGQGVLMAAVEQYLRPIEYGSDRLARLWRPADRILVDPDIQVGHPCVDGTRVTTETVSGRVGLGEPLALIADDLELELLDVEAALLFEEQLDSGRGLALVD